MPRKLSYEEVKNYIEDKGCELLESKYVNSSTKMKIKCSCGNIFIRDFSHFKRGQIYCSECIKEKTRKNSSLKYEDVKKYINEHDCTLISETYKNYSEKLKIRCKCGNIFYKSFQHFKAGQNRCPECGKKINIKSRTKYTLEVAKKLLKEKGYEMLNENDYIDGYKPIKCKCSKGHIFDIKIGYLVVGKSGCRKCANEKLKGANHWNYKGGESEIIDLARKSLKEWREMILKRDNYCCVFTQDKDCVVHHIDSFSNIINLASTMTNIPILTKIKDYENLEDVYTLINKIKELHTLETGITLSKDIHKSFHKKYGYGYNTREQFEAFITDINMPVRFNREF